VKDDFLSEEELQEGSDIDDDFLSPLAIDEKPIARKFQH
jgi:hypothetical protein